MIPFPDLTADIAACTLCPGRGRIPLRPPVCDSCRSWLSHVLGDIRIYAGLLVGADDQRPDLRLVTKSMATARPPRPAWIATDRWRELDKQTSTRYGDPRDPVAASVPSGVGSARSGAAPVTGSKRPPSPVSDDRIDLTLPARAAGRALFARGEYGLATDADQIGHLPLATTLDTWVRDWADLRHESRPAARTAIMLRWMRARVDWACDEYPAVDDLAAELRSYRSTMRGLLGLVEVPDHKVGVSCPQCHNRSLYRENGNWYIECAECPQILSPKEYLERARDNVTCLACSERMERHFAVGLAVAATA